MLLQECVNLGLFVNIYYFGGISLIYRIKENNMKSKAIKALLLSVIFISGTSMISACAKEDVPVVPNSQSSVEDASEEATSEDSVSEPTAQATPEEVGEEDAIIEIDHSVDTNPEPLEEADKVLSNQGYGAIGALADEDMSIVDMLMYAMQDEYLARGEYQAIIDEFGNQKPYSNIIRAENTHISYLEEVYVAYELDIPEDTSSEHTVIPTDLLEAAKTGVQAEIDNIAMYEQFLSYELPTNIEEVFTALRDASKSHLMAFEKQVKRLSN